MLKKFFGGIHPSARKERTEKEMILDMPLPSRVILPMSQHIGAPCTPLVKVGDLVKTGQKIATSPAAFHADIHASLSGKVIQIAQHPHAVQGKGLAVVIESDGQDCWEEGKNVPLTWQSLPPEVLLERVQDAGVVGLGGAAFPTHLKLHPQKKVDILLLNGAECEPYLTADDRLMQEAAEKVAVGVQILRKILGIQNCFVGIEENKRAALHSMQKVFREVPDVKVCALPVRYPQGAEKMLIYALTGREVPAGGLPMDVGVVVQNVGTVAAVFDAVVQNRPLIERITTVSGDAVAKPKNLRVRLGTTFQEAFDFCGGFLHPPVKVLSGGPMMGIAQADLQIPIMKGTSGILAFSQDLAGNEPEGPCIRCGQCVSVCPMGLIPSMLGLLSERGDFQTAKESYGLFTCMECGSCAYICPAKRNLVQWIRQAKMQNRTLEKRQSGKK